MGVVAKHAYRFGYLKSEEWQNVRAEVLANGHGECFICGYFSINNDVHHRTYPKDVWQTKASDCIVLCRDCHSKVHVLLKNGLELDPKTLGKLRDYIRSKKEMKLAARASRIKGKIEKAGPRCICCHRNNVPITQHLIHQSRHNPEMWLWCENCWNDRPKEEPIKWSALRKFFDTRREATVKNMFDSIP